MWLRTIATPKKRKVAPRMLRRSDWAACAEDEPVVNAAEDEVGAEVDCVAAGEESALRGSRRVHEKTARP